VWLIQVVVCLLAAPWVQLLANVMDGHIVCCSAVSSYQSAATSDVVNYFLVTNGIQVSSTITSTRTLPLAFRGSRGEAADWDLWDIFANASDKF